jgi:F-type H+-transporting ATPase subunit delta
MNATNNDLEKIKEYARAILDIGRATGDVDLLETELKSVRDEIVSNLNLKKYLTDPSIAQSDKINMGLEILKDGASSAVRTAMVMIITLDISEYVDPLYQEFTSLVNDFKKQAYVEVVSAIELDQRTTDKIKKDVDKASGLDVRVKNTVDPSIVGGLIIKIGEKVIDLSVKNKMDDIKTKLKSIELGGEGFGTED